MNVVSAARAVSSNTPLASLRVLAVSPVNAYGGHNTSVHRIQALESLGCGVTVIDSTWPEGNVIRNLGRRVRNRLFRLGLPVSMPDGAQVGWKLREAVRQNPWDVVWLERELCIGPDVLRTVRVLSPNSLIVGFSPDDMAGRHNQSTQFLHALPFYDVFLTTKSYNVLELQELGCPEVRFIGNGYDPVTFRPVAVSPDDERRLGGEIGFIGSYEQARSEMLYLLASSGFKVRVWGGGWNRAPHRHPNLHLECRPLYGDDFAKGCAAFKINLGFLRKLNRDLQTTRSVEIPACGGFMLAERTSEHQELFVEGEEAEFFDSPEELLEKCRFYLAHEVARRRIAERGYQRCLRSDYSNAGRLAAVFPYLLARLERKA